MPERKSHVKSRLGCVQCKSRRVKCDEVRPTCGNCKRRQESCSYLKAKGSIHATPSPDASGLDQANGIHHGSHIKQLELMHHFSTSTWETLTIDSKVLENHGMREYQIEVPRLALTHDFLLDTVFAITSLHLAYVHPENGREYIADATRYHTRALAACQAILPRITASECRPLYYTSAMLGMITLGFRSVDHEYRAVHKPTETLSMLAALWHGTLSIINASKDLMDEETHRLFFPLPDWDRQEGSVLGAQSHVFLEKLREKARAETRPNDTDEMTDVDPSAIYLETIDQLQLLLDAYELEFSRVLAWLVIVPPQFIDFMVQEQPLANAIILLYSVVFRTADERWWARNFRRHLVDELASVVAESDPDFVEMANWVEGWTRPAEELAPFLTPHEQEVASIASWADEQTQTSTTRSNSMAGVEGVLT